ncbi:helix-turn-helix transcriptional regulator [Vallitalea guaymasensis]|uniref:helix-turn-helix transcriptional regulator n=1 Tax=Vallitalea guaymasensis TaxID=1185412 RepID=UPI000DE448D3|nr:helix-turn-helix transcriptional regulator [Vallitalea guaymasensis]
MNLKSNLKQLRLDNDLSQLEVAEKIGIHQSQLSRYENNKDIPGAEILYKFQKIYGWTVIDLYKEV